jgi:hypothetical protein
VARFGQNLELYWLSNNPGGVLRIGTSLFQRHGLTIPHYDWLRSADDQIIGVRYWPFEDKNDTEFISTFFSDVAAVCDQVIVDDGAIEIFFSEARAYDGDRSCDQAFGVADIYYSADREYALILGTDWLHETEVAALHASPFNWK